MYRIAIVDDENSAAEALEGQIRRYAGEAGADVETVRYESAMAFLSNYQANFDIVFMDIEMPYLNGMEGAAKLREIDRTTLLIFATNLGHMAVQGYTVEAFDFIIKPVRYELLRMKLERAFRRLERERVRNVSFNSDGARLVMPADQIRYVEVADHRLVFHTESGDYPAYGTMAKLRGQLEPLGFFLCNNCYLVNLRFVRRVEKFTVTVGEDALQISRPRRKAFLQALNDYIGG